MAQSSQETVCQSCLGHGYRVEVSPHVSMNAEAAKANYVVGERVPCPSCLFGEMFQGDKSATPEANCVPAM